MAIAPARCSCSLIGGLVDFGKMYYTQSVMTNAAREGARHRAALGPTGRSQDSTTRITNSPPARPRGYESRLLATTWLPNAMGPPSR